MDGFTKLFSSIITSSIWSEDDKTRIMWITMLASADARGHVDGAIPGMAAIARMSLLDAEQAIARLSAPDPYSRTADQDGRRIIAEPGGWRVVNYAAYREKRDPETRKEQNRDAKRRQRQRCQQYVSQCQPEVSQDQPGSAQAEAEAEAEKISSAARSHCALAQNVGESPSAQEESATESTAKSERAQDPNKPTTIEGQNFEQARRLYPGKKRGFRVEFENFRKHHTDWRELLDDEGLAECVQTLIDRKAYSPGFWPHFQTFVDQSRFEEALQPQEAKR